MAFLAFPAVADTTTLTVTNRSGFLLTDLYVDGDGLGDWTGNRVPAGGLQHGGSLTFSVECDSSGDYRVLAGAENTERYWVERIYCGRSHTLWIQF